MFNNEADASVVFVAGFSSPVVASVEAVVVGVVFALERPDAVVLLDGFLRVLVLVVDEAVVAVVDPAPNSFRRD